MGSLKARLSGIRSGFGRLSEPVRRGAPAYGVLLISLLLTGLAWFYVRETVETQNRVRFDEAVRATRAAIERRTVAYLDAMYGARGLFLASEMVDRPEWNDYVGGIDPGERLKGVQALAYVELVTPEERASFEREAREENLPEMWPDLEPGGERPAYFPLRLVAPANTANQSTINEDLYADPVHRTAMDRARDTGSPQATGMVYVMTEPSAGSSADLALRPGFAVYLPVYREGEAHGTVEERRRALQGFVGGTFRRDGLLDDVFAGEFEPAIDFEVYDGAGGATELLYDNDGVRRAGEEDAALFSERGEIRVAGREWGLYFATLPDFESEAESSLPLFVLLSGLAASLLLFGITQMLVRSRIHAEGSSRDLENANRELEGANRELEAFSYSVSHDLRAPLRSIDGFSQILLEDYADVLDEEGRGYLGRVRAASEHMGHLIDDLLDLSRVSRGPLRRELVNLGSMAEGIVHQLRKEEPERDVEFVTEEGIMVFGDANLLTVALENLLGNSWKFTEREPKARIELGAERRPEGPVFFVRDNGAGFEMAYADKLFGAFQRLHSPEEFEGTGIGLATVARIVHRHGGRVWAEGEVGKGATFFFTLGAVRRSPASALPPKKAETG